MGRRALSQELYFCIVASCTLFNLLLEKYQIIFLSVECFHDAPCPVVPWHLPGLFTSNTLGTTHKMTDAFRIIK